MKNEKVRILCEGAICVALSCALNFLELNLWYQGGSIGLSLAAGHRLGRSRRAGLRHHQVHL